MNKLYHLLCAFLMIAAQLLPAQTEPGDIFREYIWTTPKGSNSPYLRVGGKMDYEVKQKIYGDLKIDGRKILFGHELELDDAIRAEIIAQKVLCHFGTQNLRISLNGHEEIKFPESDSIPEPQNLYMHYFSPRIEVPLEHLNEGAGNYFTMQVDTNKNWPQNLVYGILLRVYYDPSSADLGKEPELQIEENNENQIKIGLAGSFKGILKVDYIGKYYGPDLNGDGKYSDWHYQFHRDEIINHIGTSTTKPHKITWDIGWIPDQKEEVLLSARVYYDNGLIRMAPEKNCSLIRSGYSIELCKPQQVPQKWVTRKGENQELFTVTGDIDKINQARLIFTSWSPGYMNGIYINDFIVFTREGARYSFMQHNVPITETDIFKMGTNVLKTGGTPRYDGKMVHGTEIMWPGIMVLIKYNK